MKVYDTVDREKARLKVSKVGLLLKYGVKVDMHKKPNNTVRLGSVLSHSRNGSLGSVRLTCSRG